jgi:hypothetical protein
MERKALQYFFFFLLRKINILWDEFLAIWHGSGSIFLGIVFFPVLVLRMILDTFILIRNITRKNLKRIFAVSRQ